MALYQRKLSKSFESRATVALNSFECYSICYKKKKLLRNEISFVLVKNLHLICQADKILALLKGHFSCFLTTVDQNEGVVVHVSNDDSVCTKRLL